MTSQYDIDFMDFLFGSCLNDEGSYLSTEKSSPTFWLNALADDDWIIQSKCWQCFFQTPVGT